jgi:hypothetical protein
MKTAMQELRETIWAMIENGGTEEDLFAVIAHIDKALEKEKEQIIQAHGLKYYDIGEVTITGENYYNQTYNQKQHIIDIMKADEDNDLYNQIN